MFTPSIGSVLFVAILIGCSWNKSQGHLLASNEPEEGQQMFSYLARPRSVLDLYASQPRVDFGLEQPTGARYITEGDNVPGYLADADLIEADNELLARHVPSGAELLDLEETKRDLKNRLATINDYNELAISAPVNDPAEFQTQTLGLASNQSEALDNLLNTYLGLVNKQVQLKDVSREEAKEVRSDHNDQPLATTTITTDNEHSVSSTISASRYGTGEYIDHPLALIGHQYVQGGAGEGRQLLGPDGSFENVQVIKSDHAVPSYCDPPNPCPIGFTAEDGCLENFINSASFSREYQAKQQCSCDNEHSLFNCASPVSTLNDHQLYSATAKSSTDNSQEGGDGEANDKNGGNSIDLNANKLDTLARTIQNRFGNMASVRNLIAKHEERMS